MLLLLMMDGAMEVDQVNVDHNTTYISRMLPAWKELICV